MMKKQLLLLVILFVPMMASAEAVEINGIFYNLITNGMYAEVSSNPDGYANEVVIPESVRYNGSTFTVSSIGSSAFSNCSSLTSITIPNTVTVIGEYAFYSCEDLRSITIPNSVVNIGSYSFNGCKSLTNINIPNSVTSIGRNAFQSCSGLKSISIPASVTSVGINAFQGCSGLTSITIPTSLATISDGTFAGCANLMSVTIPNSVTSIGYGAFRSCISLNTVVIGSKVAAINERAFASCPDMKDIYCLSETVPVTDKYAFDDTPLANVTLHVPAASLYHYMGDNVWKNCREVVAYDGTLPTAKKCAAPEIAYQNGRLIFSCETSDVEYEYDVKVRGSKNGNGDEVKLSPSMVVSVYATKEGYENSDVVTKTISLAGGSQSTGKTGDVNGDGKVDIVDVTTVIDIILKAQ